MQFFYINKLTENVNLKGASGSVSSSIVGGISDVVSSPEQGQTRTVTALLRHSNDANVVREDRLIPRDGGGAIAGHDPDIARAVVNNRSNLKILFQI